jgi:branched-subunit amino acid aminotransferase/4-amino-4-deoxychorismate lyase
VRFKTTRRAHYEALAPCEPGVFDTLLWNRHGELTECTRGNVAVQLDGRWVTPPLHCGLLDGIGRARYLREGRLVEAVVRLDDVPRATGLAFVNSLRGWLDAVLVESP